MLMQTQQTGLYVSLIQNLPIFGVSMFLVLEQTMNGTRLRGQFKSSAAADKHARRGTFDTAVIGGTSKSRGEPQAGTLESRRILLSRATEGISHRTHSHSSGVWSLFGYTCRSPDT